MRSIKPAALVALLAGGAAAAFLSCIHWVHDPDTFHHLAYGRELAAHGLRSPEPFLFPLAGQVTAPLPYWLGSLLIYGWHHLTGDGALALLPALVAAILFVVLAIDSLPSGRATTLGDLGVASLPLALAVGAFVSRSSARPETFAFVLLALTALLVRRHLESGTRWIWALPPIFLLWTNVHASAVMGIALLAISVAATLAERLLRRPDGPPAVRPKSLLVALLLSSGAALATPAAVNPVTLALRFLASTFPNAVGQPAVPSAGGDALGVVAMLVVEMSPPRLHEWSQPWALLAGLTLLLLIVRWRSAPLRVFLMVVAFALLAARATRFTAILAIVCAPIAARQLQAILASLPAAAGRLPLRAVAAALAPLLAVAALALPPPGPRQLTFGTALWRGAYPVRGADYLEKIGFDGRLYDTFHFGGYLEWRGIHGIYQDGRGEWLPGVAEASMLGPADRERFAALDARFAFDAVLLAYPKLSPGAEEAGLEGLRARYGDSDWVLDRANWSLVAFDDGGLLYLRRDGRYAALASRDEYKLVKPANTGVVIPRWQLPALMGELRRSVQEAPQCLRCRVLLASFALASPTPAPSEAKEALAGVLEVAYRQRPDALFVAAQAEEALGRPLEARDLYLRYLTAEPADADAGRAVARIALSQGDPRAARKALRENLAAGRASGDDYALAYQIALALGDAAEAERWRAAAWRSGQQAAAQGHFLRAVEAERLGDLQGAIASYGTGLSIDPTNAGALSDLGFVLQKAGQLDAALDAHRRALELDPKLSSASFGIGTILAERGDAAGAAKALRRYLELEPHGYWALKARQRLEELERR